MWQKLVQYLRDSKSELRKVSWLTRQDTTRHTVMVIGISLALAAFLGFFDFIFSFFMGRIIK